MKRIILIGFIAMTIQLTASSTYSQVAASDENQNYQGNDFYQTDDVSYQTFYNDLSQYGQWINYPGYGSVWQPAVGSDFRPYASNGHWVYSDMGWTWSSDFEWGWAAFHYGRWFFDNSDGWLWVPGYDWAPAWVSWRSNADYYGWAPLMPNVPIDVCFSSYRPPVNYWSFVPNQFIASDHVYNYYLSTNRYSTIINNTTIINNRYVRNNRVFATGPASGEVERITHNAIHPIALSGNIREVTRINNDQLHIFRPRISNVPFQGKHQSAAFIGSVQSGNSVRVETNSNGQLGNPKHFPGPANDRPAVLNRNNTYANGNSAGIRSDNSAYFNRNNADGRWQNAFQRQVEQRAGAPLANAAASRFQPQVSTMPAERPNVSTYRPSQPDQQRMMSRPAAPAIHFFAPAAANRNFNRK